jgi:two-component system cell cycle sensor histidine kinase/response regulator CckA
LSLFGLRRLLEFGRQNSVRHLVLIRTKDVAQTTIVKNTFPKNIKLAVVTPVSTWPVWGDPTRLHQALLNICVNDRDAMPGGGLLTICVENREFDEKLKDLDPQGMTGPGVVIKVADPGTGLAPEIVDRVFEPFFTTKDCGKGIGIGLPTVLSIVKSHAGCIDLQ